MRKQRVQWLVAKMLALFSPAGVNFLQTQLHIKIV